MGFNSGFKGLIERSEMLDISEMEEYRGVSKERPLCVYKQLKYIFALDVARVHYYSTKNSS